MNRILSAFLLLFAAFTSICQEADSLKTNMKQAFKDEDFELCCAYAEKLLENATSAKDTNNILVAYYYLGYANQKNGDLENGLKYGTMCYELATLANDQEIVSSSLNNIGNIYLINKQDSTALTYFMKSLEIERATGRKQNQATRLGNISSVYLRLERYDKALEYAKQGLDIDLEIGRKDKIAVRYNQLGNIYNYLGDFSKSLECQTNSFDYFKCAGSIYDMAITSHSIGQIYDRLYDYENAKQFYLQGLDYAKQINNRLIIEKSYRSLYDFSRNTDPAFSLKYLELYTALKDSVYNAKSQQLMEEFHAKYETKEKEHEIEIQNAELEQTHFRFRVTIFIIAILIIAVILLIISIKSAFNKHKILEGINDTKDRMLSIISHDLKNPVIAEHHVLYQLKKLQNGLTGEEYNAILDSIINSNETQITLLNNLLQWTRIQVGKADFTPIAFDLTSCIKDTVALFENHSNLKKISIVFDEIEKKTAFSDKNIISTVTRNLISNALKYSNEGGAIEIKITDHSPEKYLLTVIDHGIGMSEETISKLFSDEKTSSVTGTSGEPGNGLGLSICKRLLTTCHESYFVESQLNEGSKFSFTVNKSND